MSDCEFIPGIQDSFTEELRQTAKKEGIPLSGIFELTARCNFNCKMCYVHLAEDQIREQGRELSNKEWLKIAEEARRAGMLNLTLTGGEIFVRKDFRELYAELKKMGFLVNLMSNGYLIDEETMEWLAKDPPYAMRFTLYGASNETYEKVTGIPDGFDRVSHAVDLVRKTDIPFYLMGLIIKENNADLLKLYDFARDRNLFFQHSIAVVSPVRGARQDAAAHRVNVTDYPLELFKNFPKIDRLYVHKSRQLDECAHYRTGFYVTWNGRMQLCSFLSEPSEDVLGMGFDGAWKKLLDDLAVLPEPEECGDCRYAGFCRRCPGVLAAECGGPDKVSDFYCGQARFAFHAYHNE
ncbi:MAG: radical SAM protein [Lachnospiraceae bacterium]|nr:radical SAM protein [Lachnospiraceae bacterium]